MNDQKPEVETIVATGTATSTKVALGILIVSALAAIVAITAGLFTA